MALAAPGRSGGPQPEAAASARSGVGSPHGVRFTDIVDLDSKAGSPEWGRPGFVFSARVRERRPDGLLLLETPFGRLGLRGEASLSGSVRFRVERFGQGFALRLLGRGPEPAAADRAGGRAPTEAAFLRGLGLPADALCASLVSFARAFGLGLAPAALKALRRTATRQSGDREAAALAAVAAEAKGTRLADGALREYVAAIDVDAGGGRRDGGSDGDRSSSSRRDRGAWEERKRSGTPSAEDLRDRFGEAAASGDALSYLNRLPASDGTRWIVFPVRPQTEGVEFRAVVRILLLADHGSGPRRVGRWAVDVAAGGRTWSFDADCLGAQPPSLRVSADPPLGMESARVRAALAPVFEPLGHVVQVSASRDDRRFSEARSDAPAAVDAEA